MRESAFAILPSQKVKFILFLDDNILYIMTICCKIRTQSVFLFSSCTLKEKNIFIGSNSFICFHWVEKGNLPLSLCYFFPLFLRDNIFKYFDTLLSNKEDSAIYPQLSAQEQSCNERLCEGPHLCGYSWSKQPIQSNLHVTITLILPFENPTGIILSFLFFAVCIVSSSKKLTKTTRETYFLNNCIFSGIMLKWERLCTLCIYTAIIYQTIVFGFFIFSHQTV